MEQTIFEHAVTLVDQALQDVLPDGVALVSATPPPTRTSTTLPRVLEWDVPPLDAGRSNTVSVRVKVDGAPVGSTLDNQAQISSNEAQPKSASASSVVRTAPLLTLTKTVSAPVAHPGDSVEYTISYANTGKGEARNVVLTDRFPSALITCIVKTGTGR